MLDAKQRRSGTVMYGLAVLYIAVPMMIFLAGWAKWWIAVIGICVILFGMYKMLRNVPEQEYPALGSHIGIWIAVLLIITVWVYMSGVGRLSYQNGDHLWRNRIFRLLVNQDWPVVKRITIDGVEYTRGMVYYIGFWLPAAVIGKLFGLTAGYCFQAIWAVAGIFLFYYFLCVYLKKVAVWPVVVFALFSGLDMIGNCVMNGGPFKLFGMEHLELWAGYMQYSSNTTLLFWVFNQAVPIWLILMMVLIQKKNRNMVLIISFALLTSTLPFIGLIPFFLYQGIKNYSGGKGSFSQKFGSFCRDTFTIENVICGGFVGIFSFLYLRENGSGQHIAINPIPSFRPFLMRFLVFLTMEVFVYLIATYRYQKKRFLYWMLIPLFVFIPLVQIGFSMDFCMRASIPALTVLCILVIDTMFRSRENKDWVTLTALIVVFALGSLTSLQEINRSIFYTVQDIGMNDQVKVVDVLGSGNFSCDAEDSFFFSSLSSGWTIKDKEEEEKDKGKEEASETEAAISAHTESLTEG